MPAATGCARSMPWRRSPTNIRTTCSRNLSRARRRVHAGAPFRGLGRGHPFQQEVGMPTMHGGREYVEDDGLMSYGPDISDMFRRTADFVAKLPHGAKPGRHASSAANEVRIGDQSHDCEETESYGASV